MYLHLVLVGMSVFSKNQADKCFKPKEIKKAMIKAAMWQFANPKHELWDWTNGAFLRWGFGSISNYWRPQTAGCHEQNGPKLTNGNLDHVFNMPMISRFARPILICSASKKTGQLFNHLLKTWINFW